MLVAVLQCGAKFAQRSEARVTVDVQDGFAVGIGEAGRNDNQFAFVTFARFVNSGDGVGIASYSTSMKSSANAGNRVIAPASTDMMQNDPRAHCHTSTRLGASV